MKSKKMHQLTSRAGTRYLKEFEGHLQMMYRQEGDTESGLNLASVYQGLGKYDQALELLDSMLLKANPESRLAIVMRQGEVCVAADRMSEARGYFKAASEGGMSEALLALARLNLCEGEVAEAESYARRASSAGVGGSDEFLGDLLAYQGNWEGALAQFQHLYSSNHEVAGKLGVCLVNVRRGEEAIPYLRESISRGDLSMTRRLIEAYYWIGSYRNGVIYGEIGLSEGLDDLHGMVGLCLMKLKDYASAASHLEVALQQRDRLDGLCFSLGQCYVELGRPEDALRCQRLAVRRKERNACYGLGLLHKSSGRYGEASRCFRKSLERQEEQSAFASYELGWLCNRRHDSQGAEKHYQDAWLGGCVRAGISLGIQALAYGDSDRAISWFRQVLDQGHSEVLPKLAMAYLMKDDVDKARELLLRAHEEGQAEASLGLAMICKREGNDDEAERFFEESVEKKVPSALSQYGRELLSRGDILSATGYLRKAWEEEHDATVLIPLAFAYFSLQTGTHQDKILEYLKLAEDRKEAMDEVSADMLKHMKEKMGRMK